MADSSSTAMNSGGCSGGGGGSGGTGRELLDSNKSPHHHHHGSNNSRHSNGSLFLTLPSNFSPGGGCGGSSSPGSSSGSPSPGGERKGSAGGGSRASPMSQHHHTWEDLRRLFLVSLEKMSRMEPESIPFRQPVDPEELGIPDYNDIIRKPMDLQTIRNKMNTGKYTEPYAYVDDVLRMLDNAWLYNREGSKIHEYCTRLSIVFINEINKVLAHLGYKQGRSNSFLFNSDTVTCHGRPVCFVGKGKGFWRDTSRDMEFNLCEECYGVVFASDVLTSSLSSCVVAPDVIPMTSGVGKGGATPPPAAFSHQSSFVFTINSCKAYSPAAELHKSYMRDAEMSRQLVLREFLRMLMASDTSTERKCNVYKMLRCNGKLLGEFIEYVKRRRGIVVGDKRSSGGASADRRGGRKRIGECCVVYGESFTTNDLDGLLERLKGLKVEEEQAAKRKSLNGSSSERDIVAIPTTVCGEQTDKEDDKVRTMTSDSGVESVIGSSNETLDLSLEAEGSCSSSAGVEVCDDDHDDGGGRGEEGSSRD